MVDKTEIIYDLLFKTDAAQQDVASLTVQLKTAQDALRKFQGESNNAGNAFRRSARGATDAGKAYGKIGNSVQNAGFQFADLATQISGGVDATRALAQQLPQLLGGFGALGAVAGAAVAILVPLGVYLLNIRDYSKELEDGIEKLEDAQKNSKATIVDLTEEYGKYATVVLDVAKAQELLANNDISDVLRDQADAARELGLLFQGTEGFFGEFKNRLVSRFNDLSFETLFQSATEYQEQLEKLRVKFGLTKAAAEGLLGPFMDFQNALQNTNTDAAALALQEVSRWIKANKDEAEGAAPFIELLAQQFEALAKIRPPEKNVMGFAYAPRTDANTFSNYKGNAEVAKQLAEIEKKAADAKKATTKATRDAEAAQRALNTEFETFIGSVERGATPLQRLQDTLRKAEENFARFNDRMSGEQIAAYTAYISDLNARIEEVTFKDRWDKMAEGLSSVKTPLMEFHESIKEIGASIKENLASGLTDAFMSFIDGTKSAKDAFKTFAVDFLKQITQMIIKATILYAINAALGMVGGGGGGGGGFLSGLLGGGASLYGGGGPPVGIAPLRAAVPQASTFSALPAAPTGFTAGPVISSTAIPNRATSKDSRAQMNVSINNYAGAEVQTRQASDGRLQIDILKRELASEVMRGGTDFAKAFEQGYGLRRRGR